MTSSLANDLAYLEGQVSAALRHDSRKKIKCKQGYIQRGSACQKIFKKTPDNGLARNIGAGLGAAALVGGAAAIAARGVKGGESIPREEPSKTQIPSLASIAALPKKEKISLAKKYLAAGVATATTAVGSAIIQNRGKYLSLAAEKTVSAVVNFATREKSSKPTGEGRDSVSQVLIKRRIKDLNNPAYIEGSTKVLTELAKKPEVAAAISTFIMPEFSGATDLEEAKSRASKVIVREVLTNPETRDAAMKYGATVASEWAKDPEMRRIAGESVAKGVSGGKDESTLSSSQKILRRSEKDTILLATALSLAFKGRTLKGVWKSAEAITEQKVSKINENRDSADGEALSEDEVIFGAVYAFYQQKKPKEVLATKADNCGLSGDLSYLEGRASVTARYDANRKLRCKDGYIQRGNACQKTIPKASGGNLARNIGTGLGVAALAGAATGVAIASKRQSSGQVPTTSSVSPSLSLSDSKVSSKEVDPRLIKVAKAAALTAVTYLAAKKIDRADKDMKISFFLGLLGTSMATVKSSDLEKKVSESSGLSTRQKDVALSLMGKSKVALMRMTLSRGEFELESTDRANNSFTYRNKKSGSVQTIGSAGASMLTFKSEPVGYEDSPVEFEMGFGVDFGVDRSPARSIQSSKALIRIAKAAFAEHVRLLPDNCAIGCTVANTDGAGKKRQGIYEQAGFAYVEGMGKFELATAKVGGELIRVKTEADKRKVREVARRVES